MKNVYFIGIGGIGMSAIARYFKFKGYEVAGYDRTPSELTARLEVEGIPVHYEDRPELVPADVQETLVVYTPAIPSDLGELRKVMDGGYRVLKRSRTLGEITRGQRCLAVAGTHGKTTTSTLTAHILTECGEGCSAFLGGISRNYGTNLLMSENATVVVEADEFDRSFLQLYPEIAVITSVEADHLDIYGKKAPRWTKATRRRRSVPTIIRIPRPIFMPSAPRPMRGAISTMTCTTPAASSGTSAWERPAG